MSLKLIFLNSFFFVGYLSESRLPADKGGDWFDYTDGTDFY